MTNLLLSSVPLSVETTEIRPDQSQPSTAHNHACRRCQHDYWLALDRLRRANRDLAETAAVMAASLTTVTAIQAVISIAVDRLNLPKDDLEWALYAYVAVIASIFAIGVVRSMKAFGRRGKAEREIDRAKGGIFEFCPEVQWPQPEG